MNTWTDPRTGNTIGWEEEELPRPWWAVRWPFIAGFLIAHTVLCLLT